jgi:hypothetical protein
MFAVGWHLALPLVISQSLHTATVSRQIDTAHPFVPPTRLSAAPSACVAHNTEKFPPEQARPDVQEAASHRPKRWKRVHRQAELVTEAKQQGSLQVALSGLNAIRQTLDSLSRLAGFDRQGAQVNVAVQTNVNVSLTQIAERVIDKFDHEPELKARIAQALLEVDNEQLA